MKSTKINFENQHGERLSAKLEFPAKERPVAFAIFAHCFTCNKNLTAVANIARALSARGIAVMRFDFTGLGESEGDFADTSFSSNVSDLVAAADFLAKNHTAPAILIGHSLGGAAVLNAARLIASIKAVVTIGAPYSPEHVTHLFEAGLDEIKSTGTANVNIGGRSFTIRKDFIDDLEAIETHQVIHNMNIPLMVMHSPIDSIVGASNAAQIYKAAQHPKNFISLDGADHLLSRKSDSLFAGAMIAAWAERYIDIPEETPLSTQMQVSTRTTETYTTDIAAGNHNLVADEPASVGGNDYGPTPYDYLLAALGACTGMTLRMYANHKKWPLEEVKVHLAHGKRYADDCGDSESNSAKIDHIDRTIELSGDLDETQRKRLLEIADKCPVHKTLHSEIKVTTTAKESS